MHPAFSFCSRDVKHALQHSFGASAPELFYFSSSGIAVSNDPVLQTRVMAYADAQRYRLGVNYQMLPVNIPVCPFHNNHNDGAMNYIIKDEEASFRPKHS